jgi:hypothetical protein
MQARTQGHAAASICQPVTSQELSSPGQVTHLRIISAPTDSPATRECLARVSSAVPVTRAAPAARGAGSFSRWKVACGRSPSEDAACDRQSEGRKQLSRHWKDGFSNAPSRILVANASNLDSTIDRHDSGQCTLPKRNGLPRIALTIHSDWRQVNYSVNDIDRQFQRAR